MFPALQGRIDRKTFIIGNLIAFGAFLMAAALIMIPLAIVSIVANSGTLDEIIGFLVFLVAIPGIFYYLYFCILMIKRAHDIGWPGLLLVSGFTLAVIFGRILDIYQLNFLAILILLFFCIKPGMKSRNNFGPVPRKKFKIGNLKVTY